VNPAGEWRGLGALERFENFCGVLPSKSARFFIPAEIQFAERFEFQVEQVERFLDEAAFELFFRDNAAERFGIERLVFRKMFDAPRELRRTARDILATPRDVFIRRKRAGTRCLRPLLPWGRRGRKLGGSPRIRPS
jgi:hypothetical protein